MLLNLYLKVGHSIGSHISLEILKRSHKKVCSQLFFYLGLSIIYSYVICLERSLSDACLLCYRLYIALVYILFWLWTLNLQHSPPLEDLQRIALPCNVEFFHFFFSGFICMPSMNVIGTNFYDIDVSGWVIRNGTTCMITEETWVF